ncbi:RhuM family protein [Flavobacterium sp.]|uniref:RhuM family protein n=1 Tax=Flavobacterium sp. TaxID=239 RepID=UPI00286E965A|nr:RhuM family protein [Flavobacterium sp.]
MSKIEIYQAKNGQTTIDVTFDKETIWLSLNQISNLFNRDKSVISKHLKKIFLEGELILNSVVAKNATTASDNKIYNVDFYNLDVIISIGYRVNSIEGTQFRQWATQRLKEHLVNGYSINQKRLEQLQKTIEIIQNTGNDENLNLDEAKGLLEIIKNYTHSFVLLNQFDSNNLIDSGLNDDIIYEINYEEASNAITKLKLHLISKKEATNLFGNQKDESFKGILGNILQSFDNHYLYPTIEQQASHLLYFIIKNHPFSDGNKRIGAFMFVWFLEKNKHHFKKNGELKINDNALVAIALLVAQSNPSDKEILIKLIINLIKK